METTEIKLEEESNSLEPPSNDENEVFKSPTIIKQHHNSTESSSSSSSKDSEFLAENSALQAFAYRTPEWALTPPVGQFYIDVIKNGVILDTIKLDTLKNDSFIVFGRFPPVDIQLDHPSVSRQHLILQYGNLIPNKPGWYLYDMNSTHGTKMNKKQLQKNHYVPIDVGYVFQIAGSSRVFSFCGPETEILDDEQPTTTTSKWPITTEAANNDDGDDEAKDVDEKRYFEKDPVGWLEKYFEREGLSMNFDYTTEGRGSEVICSIELSDDLNLNGGQLISATALNRKLAQFQCALTTCERLEEKGLLRVFSIWNKRKTYADNDYYDSDEDTFFDRTGQIEEQRKKRKIRCEGVEASSMKKSKNFEQLSEDLVEAENKLEIIKSELRRIIGKNEYLEGDENFNTNNLNFSTRMAISQMRSKEKKFIEECEKLRKLIEIVRPTDLDSMFPISIKQIYLDEENNPSKLENSPAKNEIKIVENKNEIEKFIKNPINKDDDVFQEENDDEDSDNEAENESISNNSETVKIIEPPPPTTSTKEFVIIKKKERNYEPAAMPNNNIPKFGLLKKSEALIKKPIQIKQKRQQQKMDDDLMGSNYSNISSETLGEYATWLPPTDQSGDGQTKLNKKFEGRY